LGLPQGLIFNTLKQLLTLGVSVVVGAGDYGGPILPDVSGCHTNCLPELNFLLFQGSPNPNPNNKQMTSLFPLLSSLNNFPIIVVGTADNDGNPWSLAQYDSPPPGSTFAGASVDVWAPGVNVACDGLGIGGSGHVTGSAIGQYSL
jgi:hypothetical protein